MPVIAARRRPLLVLAIPALVLIYLFCYHGQRPTFTSPTTNPNEDFGGDYVGPRIRQATMLYEGDKDKLRSIYERSVETHRKHGLRWGYPTDVLTHDLVEPGSYFNKPAYLQSLIMAELAKPENKRAHWIVWFDGDSIIMNPEIPWSIFLPPPDITDIHVLGTQDENGFNAGMLILRVDMWTVQALSEVLALRALLPDVKLIFYDQSAIDWVCSRPGYQEHFIFQPRHWWNRYFWTPDGQQPGELMLHFAGVGTSGGGGSEMKENVMREHLRKAEQEPQNWTRELSKTPYERETREYWDAVRNARTMLRKGEDSLKDISNGEKAEAVKANLKMLNHTLLRQADKMRSLVGNTTQLENSLRP